MLGPGGRLVVVGDVCLPRRRYGRHAAFPLHASIQERCRKIGFDDLMPIVWYKIANAAFETAGNSSRFLGKPYEPNAVIKNDIEYMSMETGTDDLAAAKWGRHSIGIEIEPSYFETAKRRLADLNPRSQHIAT